MLSECRVSWVESSSASDGRSVALRRVGLVQPASGFAALPERAVNDAGMEEEPGILRAFGERAPDDLACFRGAAGRGKRPGMRIEREDVRARAQLLFDERERLVRAGPARRKVERNRSGIGGRAARGDFELDRCRCIKASLDAQRVGERPLVLGKRIELWPRD